MIYMALLGTQVPEQMAANPEGLAGVEMVWKGESVARLVEQGRSLAPDVLLLDLELLGADPAATVRGLRESLQPQMILVIYSYAKRDVVSSFQDETIRILQGPVTLSTLRSQMLGLIVRSLLTDQDRRVPCPRCGSRVQPGVLQPA